MRDILARVGFLIFMAALAGAAYFLTSHGRYEDTPEEFEERRHNGVGNSLLDQ